MTQFDVAVTSDLSTTLVRAVVPHLQSIHLQTATYQLVLVVAIVCDKPTTNDFIFFLF